MTKFRSLFQGKFALPAIALAICAVLTGANSANAGMITIYALSTGGNWVEIATATGDTSSPGAQLFAGNTGPTTVNPNFTIVSAQASMTNGPQGEVASASLQINASAAGTLQIAIVSQGFSLPVGTNTPITTLGSANSATANVLSSVSATSYIDQSNGAGVTAGTNTPASLGTAVGTINGVVNGTNVTFSPASTAYGPLLTSPYAVDQLYNVTFSGAGNIVGLSADTWLAPEPASMTLLGIGIIGMAGYGWRRRRQQHAAADMVA
jgi:hypothetical protein